MSAKLSNEMRMKLIMADIMAVEIDLRHIMIAHAVLCMIFGLGAIVLPHSFYDVQNWRGKVMYDHIAHEFLRMYGALTVSIGWFVWRSRSLTDGRLKKVICETFSLCYPLQALIMLRAQYTNPDGHSAVHWLIALLFLAVGGLYAYMRFVKKIKSFELPGAHDS